MPFSIDTFKTRLKTVNASYSNHKNSSVHDLEVHLTALRTVGAAQLPVIQALWGKIPQAKQLKYRLAGAYLKQFLPKLVDATPCKPKMKYKEFMVYKTMFEGHQNFVIRYLHRHELTWQSSNGHMPSLSAVGTRERVTHRTNPAAAPFHPIICGKIPMDFRQGRGHRGADCGRNGDNHSVGNPALILRRPLSAGSVIADQVYEYTTDGITWLAIPGATYEVEKGVRQSGNQLVFYFRKQSTNNLLANRFHFEVEYAIGPSIVTTITSIPVIPASLCSAANVRDHGGRIVANRQ